MTLLVDILKIIAILAAAVIIGNWYQSGVKKARAQGKPWYVPYLSVPGILIIAVVILLPVLVYLMR